MQRRTDLPAHTQGFTVLEVLVATLLLGVLIITVLAPLTGLFGLSRTTTRQLGTAADAQRVTEQIKGLWRDQTYYDRNCIAGLSLTGVTVSVTNLSSIGTPSGAAFTPTTASGCNTTTLASTFTSVPLKRVTVTAGSGTSATVLVMDVLR